MLDGGRADERTESNVEIEKIAAEDRALWKVKGVRARDDLKQQRQIWETTSVRLATGEKEIKDRPSQLKRL